jgi:hypothetical protein
MDCIECENVPRPFEVPVASRSLPLHQLESICEVAVAGLQVLAHSPLCVARNIVDRDQVQVSKSQAQQGARFGRILGLYRQYGVQIGSRLTPNGVGFPGRDEPRVSDD